MLVDPRPYTYEYRKPRYSNPTFQSRNLYDSLYHRNPEGNDFFTQRSSGSLPTKEKLQRNQEVNENRELARNQSDMRNYAKQSQEHKISQKASQRYDQGYHLPAIGKGGDRARVSSNIVGNLQGQIMADQPSKKKQGFERFKIYERQQKPYNIISCFPKQQENNKLRNFPKLTLENKLIERGSYHTFNEEKF